MTEARDMEMPAPDMPSLEMSVPVGDMSLLEVTIIGMHATHDQVSLHENINLSYTSNQSSWRFFSIINS